MSNFTSLKSAIVSILQTSTQVNYVYDHAEPAPSGYPAVDVTSMSGSGEFADTMRNRREFVFSLLCRQERTTSGPQSAEQIIESVVNDIVDVFSDPNNYNLNNQAIFFEPLGVEFGYIQAPDVDVRTGDITLKAIVVQ